MVINEPSSCLPDVHCLRSLKCFNLKRFADKYYVHKDRSIILNKYEVKARWLLVSESEGGKGVSFRVEAVTS